MKSSRQISAFVAGSVLFAQVCSPALSYGQDNVLPRTAPRAATAPAKPAAKPVVKATIPDVALTASGKLVGMLVDAQAKPVANSEVQLRLGKEIVAKGKTDERGVFQLEAARGGIYQLATTKENVAVRLWTNRSAPPSAKKLAVVMHGDQKVVRAQDEPLASVDLGTAALLGLGIATIVVTSITLQRVNDVESDNAALQRRIATLQSEIDKVQQSISEL